MKLNLRPCPFCGSKIVKLVCGNKCYIQCLACLASSPEKIVATEAARAWNNRTKFAEFKDVIDDREASVSVADMHRIFELLQQCEERIEALEKHLEWPPPTPPGCYPVGPVGVAADWREEEEE